MLRRAAASLALAAVSVGLVLVLAELALRARPAWIGREVLLEFDPALRARIAERLGLPLKQERRCLAPAERRDGGPELCLFEPGATHRSELEPADRAAGAIESVQQDQRGFCNAPAVAARPRADVVALGDSFTWCTTVEPQRTWPAQLERRTGLAVYDLGVPGVGLHEYVELLERAGLGLAPRVAVVGIYGGNDLRDAARFAEQRARGGGGRRREGSLPMRHSYALNFAAASLEVLAQRRRRPSIDFAFDLDLGGHTIAMNRGGSDLDEVRIARSFAAGEIAPSAAWEAPLARLAALAAEHGLRVVLAYLPPAHAAYGPAVRFSDPAVGAQVTALDEAQRSALATLADRHGFVYVDCTPVLRGTLPGAGLAYFPGNLHPTPVGHALLAECVEPAVAAAAAP